MRTCAAAPLRHAVAFALFAVVLSTAFMLAAQKSETGQPAAGARSKTAKVRSLRTHKQAVAATPIQSAAQQAAPAVPAAPVWPINEQPQQARITWDSHGLRVEATNSSLDQILREVSTDTGVKIEGFNKDQRIFGTYGPGPAREVISRLLDGSGYNVLMVGGQGSVPPSRIVLTTTSSLAGAQPQPRVQLPHNEDDDEAEGPPEPEQPEQPAQPLQPPAQQTTPMRGPFGNTPRFQNPAMGQSQTQDQQNQQSNPDQ